MSHNEIIVVLGQTATGKSDLAVLIAKYIKKNFNIPCEIVSADSRQVYKKLNLGTGKITKKEMCGVTHHMLDVVSPNTTYTVAKYAARAEKIVRRIMSQNKIPIICGGTGFYIDTLIKSLHGQKPLPEVPPNTALRKKLQACSTEELYAILLGKDNRRAQNIDRYNKVRIIRALEIIDKLGFVPDHVARAGESTPMGASVGAGAHVDKKITYIGLQSKDLHFLSERILKRLNNRIKKGMIREVEELINDGISYKKLHTLGLEYRSIGEFLYKTRKDKIKKNSLKWNERLNEMKKELHRAIIKYAKRQNTYFKRNNLISWFDAENILNLYKKNPEEMVHHVLSTSGLH